MDTKYANRPDFEIVRNANPDMSNVPSDSIVTDEDTAALRKAHRRADRIMEYAADVSLIASFHYKKRNFHLVKLLEPIFIIGKRIDDIKGLLIV
jgi:ABC-type tungstate transport system permease subunit